MIKLYRGEGNNVHYWEAWEANGNVTIHWGELGTTGQTRTVRYRDGLDPEEVIAQESQTPRVNGFKEIPIDDHANLIVQYKLDNWEAREDLEKRYEVEDLLNECLGWTGNGHCDGGDIGSGTINIYSFVVDPLLAKATIVVALREAELIEGAIIAFHWSDEKEEVLWPEDFNGEFSIL